MPANKTTISVEATPKRHYDNLLEQVNNRFAEQFGIEKVLKIKDLLPKMISFCLKNQEEFLEHAVTRESDEMNYWV